MATKFKTRVSKIDALRLHAEADKSDPFAAKRMAMTLTCDPRTISDVADEAQRLTNSRLASIKRIGAEWLKPDAWRALLLMRARMPESKKSAPKKRTARKTVAVRSYRKTFDDGGPYNEPATA